MYKAEEWFTVGRGKQGGEYAGVYVTPRNRLFMTEGEAEFSGPYCLGWRWLESELLECEGDLLYSYFPEWDGPLSKDEAEVLGVDWGRLRYTIHPPFVDCDVLTAF